MQAPNLTERTTGETVFFCFPKHPEMLCGPLNWHRVVCRSKAAGAAPYSRLRLSEAVPLIPLYGRTAWTRTTLSFLNFKQIVTLQSLPPRSFFHLFSAAFLSFLPLFLVAYFLYFSLAFFLIGYHLLFRLIHCIPFNYFSFLISLYLSFLPFLQSDFPQAYQCSPRAKS